MSDEAPYGVDERGKPWPSACHCVRWHAPIPTRLFEINGEQVCPVSAQAITDLLERYENAGKAMLAHDVGFSKFQRRHARALWTGVVEDPVQSTPPPAPVDLVAELVESLPAVEPVMPEDPAPTSWPSPNVEHVEPSAEEREAGATVTTTVYPPVDPPDVPF